MAIKRKPKSKRKNTLLPPAGSELVLDRHGRITETRDERDDRTRRHDEAAVQAWYKSKLTEFEGVLKRAERKGHRGPWKKTKKRRFKDRAPIEYAWDFRPSAEYARRFLRQTVEYLYRASPEQKTLGRRGKSAMERLALLIGHPGPGRPLARRDWEPYRDEVRMLRPHVLDDAQKVVRSYRPGPDGIAEDYQAYRQQVARFINRHLPDLGSRVCIERAKRLLGRKTLRPVDLANQVVAWRLRLRPTDVQALSRRQRP